MKNPFNLVLNQKIFVKNLKNRNTEDNPLTEVTICKIGNKYFNVKDDNYEYRTKFNVDDLTEYYADFMLSYEIYLTKQDFNDKIEESKIRKLISSDISNEKLKISLEKLRKIYNIINNV